MVCASLLANRPSPPLVYGAQPKRDAAAGVIELSWLNSEISLFDWFPSQSEMQPQAKPGFPG